MQSNGQAPQLESKSLSYMEDTLNQEALMHKKLMQYSQQLTEPTSQDLVRQLANSHQQNFDSLYNYLSSHQGN